MITNILSYSERDQIATILQRRANEIASYSDEKRGSAPASVSFALELEMARLRRLADRVNPIPPEPDENR